MKRDAAGVLTQRVAEVAMWCSLQELTVFHQDSPDEARRRKSMKEAARLLTRVRYPGDSWVQRFLPNGRRWTRAMNLIKEADLDSLAPLEHQLRNPALKPPAAIGSSCCSKESRQEIVNRVIELRSSLMKSHLSPDLAIGRILLLRPLRKPAGWSIQVCLERVL